MKNGKVRFRLNNDVKTEMEDSRLNAIESVECLNTDYVRKRSTEFLAARVQQQLMLILPNLF